MTSKKQPVKPDNRKYRYHTDEDYRARVLQGVQTSRKLKRSAERDQRQSVLQGSARQDATSVASTALPKYGFPFCTSARNIDKQTSETGCFYRPCQVARLLGVSSAFFRKKVYAGEYLSPDYVCERASATEFRTALYSDKQIALLLEGTAHIPCTSYGATILQVNGAQRIVFSRGALMTRLNVSRDVILRLESQGVLPESPLRVAVKSKKRSMCRSYYTSGQIEVVATALVKYYSFLRSRESEEVTTLRKQISEEIVNGWREQGLYADFAS